MTGKAEPPITSAPKNQRARTQTRLLAAILALACAHRDAEISRDGPSTVAKKYPFAYFFTVIKRQVRAKWAPERQLLALDPDGRRYGFESRLTLIRLELHPAGTIRDLGIEQKSGIDLLDELALSTLRQAAPFPPPPEKLFSGGRLVFCFAFPFRRPDPNSNRKELPALLPTPRGCPSTRSTPPLDGPSSTPPKATSRNAEAGRRPRQSETASAWRHPAARRLSQIGKSTGTRRNPRSQRCLGRDVRSWHRRRRTVWVHQSRWSIE